MRAIVCVPEHANPVKVESIRGLGAEMVFTATTSTMPANTARSLSREHGHRYVHSANEPALIAGVGTYTLETLERQPDIDMIDRAGRRRQRRRRRVHRGQCDAAGDRGDRRPVGGRAGRLPLVERGRLVEDEIDTVAEGLADPHRLRASRRILRERLDDFVLASEDETTTATGHMIERTRNLIEAAGAAPLAAALNLDLAGGRSA